MLKKSFGPRGGPTRPDSRNESDTERMERKLDHIHRSFKKQLREMEANLMSKADEINAKQDALAAKFDEATNEVERDLKALRDELAANIANGLTAEQATTVLANLDAKLTPISDRLIELGKDPANPVPAA